MIEDTLVCQLGFLPHQVQPCVLIKFINQRYQLSRYSDIWGQAMPDEISVSEHVRMSVGLTAEQTKWPPRHLCAEYSKLLYRTLHLITCTSNQASLLVPMVHHHIENQASNTYSMILFVVISIWQQLSSPPPLERITTCAWFVGIIVSTNSRNSIIQLLNKGKKAQIMHDLDMWEKEGKFRRILIYHWRYTSIQEIVLVFLKSWNSDHILRSLKWCYCWLSMAS